MISVEALCEHALTVSAAPDYCSKQIRSFFRDSRDSSARLVGQKRKDIGGRLPASLLEGRSAISGFVFVPQPWGMLPAKLFSQICSTSGSGKSPTNSGSESQSLFRNRLRSIKFGVGAHRVAVGISARPGWTRRAGVVQNLVPDSASGENYGVAISLRERITDPGHIWNAEFLSSRGTEANLDQASPIHAFSRSPGARDDGPVILFGSLTGPGFTPAVLRSVTTGTRSGMTNFSGLIYPVVALRFDYLSGWAPTARSRVCARQSGDADGLRILRVVLCLRSTDRGKEDDVGAQDRKQEIQEEAAKELAKPAEADGSINTIERSRSNGGGRGYRTGKVSPAIEPPSPRFSECGFCRAFRKKEKTRRRRAQVR
ncbi:hypothetical protein U1Q18_027017 [Sarracenia purpurea var. burkii]